MNNVVDIKTKKKKIPQPDFTIKPLRYAANWISIAILLGTGFALMGTSFMGLVAIAWASYFILKNERFKQ